MNKILLEIIAGLQKLLASLEKKKAELPKMVRDPIPTVSLSPREILYATTVSCFNTDASPADRAPDELACAETVNEIHRRAFGVSIDEPGVSTTKLYHALIALKSMFVEVSVPLPGDIIISPTGYGGTRQIRHGHVGIVGENGEIYSNDSDTGKLLKKWTIDRWFDHYKNAGGYRVVFFRRT